MENKISTTIKKYLFRIESIEYIIHNYDYFTTQYKIPHDTLINILNEYRETLNLVNKLTKDRDVIDIGGNCGLFSIPVARDGFNVYSFEPIKMNVDLLELNKKENKCNNLTIIPKALSNTNEKRTIYIPYCSDNTSFNQEVAISNMSKKEYVEEVVECETFDSWIENNENLNIGFIKIDVQGFEKEVLQGMQKFLKDCNDVYVFIEWDLKHTEKAGSSLNELERLLTINGFESNGDIFGDRLFYKNKV
jgi:FkbM family methyltransferase